RVEVFAVDVDGEGAGRPGAQGQAVTDRDLHVGIGGEGAVEGAGHAVLAGGVELGVERQFELGPVDGGGAEVGGITSAAFGHAAHAGDAQGGGGERGGDAAHGLRRGGGRSPHVGHQPAVVQVRQGCAGQ